MNNKINKLEQLSLLSKTLIDNLTPMYDLSNMEVVFKVDRELLTKINEELFYICNPATLEFPEETDEISLELNNIKYKYILEE